MNNVQIGYSSTTRLFINPYRYAFKGKEKDDEVKGSGNQCDYGSRMYDPRVGRFLSIDPKSNEFSFLSPYSYSANNPVRYEDIEGESIVDDVKRLGRRVKNLLTKGTFKTNQEIALSAAKKNHNNVLEHQTGLNAFRAELAAINPGLDYKPKSEIELKLIANAQAPDPDMNPGVISQRNADGFENAESWINSPSDNMGDGSLKVAAGIGYSLANSPYVLLTDRSLGGEPVTPDQKMDAFVDAVPGVLFKQIKAASGVVDVMGKTKFSRANDFSKKTPGQFTGQGHQKARGNAFKTNETTLGATGSGDKGIQGANATSNVKDEVEK